MVGSGTHGGPLYALGGGGLTIVFEAWLRRQNLHVSSDNEPDNLTEFNKRVVFV